MHAFNLSTGAFREVTSALTPANLTIDEDAGLMIYDSTQRKVYSFSEDEAVAIALETKTIPLTDDQAGKVIRYIAVTYKSATALTLKVWLNNEITSGDIQPGVLYYNNGYTAVTYNGVEYATTVNFTGVAGKSTYTKTGSGTVELYHSTELPANNSVSTLKVGIRERAAKARVRIEDASPTPTTTSTEIQRITFYFE